MAQTKTGYSTRRRPTKPTLAKRVVRAFGWLVIVGVAMLVFFNLAYVVGLKSWMMEWGATKAEVAMKVPGDEFAPDAGTVSTRAITIDAPVNEVWPWLIQMGQGRGGLYSYELLENIVGCKMTNADRIMPQYQNLEVGDIIKMGPEGYPFFKVELLEPEKSLVWANTSDVGDIGTWQWYLEEVNSDKTRLISRQRGYHPDESFFPRLMWGMTDRIAFFMERKCLLTLKALVENGN